MGELLMVTFAMLLAGTNLVINVADTIPRFDVSKTCKAAIDLSGNSGRTVASCEASENKARKEIEKDWATFPTAERNQCIQTAAKGGSPSYVEIIVCLEMIRDSRTPKEPPKTQAQRPTPAADSPATHKEGPVTTSVTRPK
jgi:hypothetical protein